MVLLLSIDGLMPGHVLAADELGLKIPNLRRFVREGAFAVGVRGVTPTLTYPAHTTLVTGCSPVRHGIPMNLTFDPELRNHKGWFWYAEDIRVPTLWGAARAAGLTTANLFWPVTVGAAIDFNVPQYWRASLDGFSGAHYVLALREGCKFGPNVLGPAGVKRSGGTHGYLPDTPEMDGVLLLIGANVPAARSLGRVDMRAIASTLASALRISLPDAEQSAIPLGFSGAGDD